METADGTTIKETPPVSEDTLTPAQALLTALFGRCTQGEIEFRTLPNVLRRWLKREELPKLPFFPPGQNVFFGVGTRKGGGSKEHVVEIPALWIDLDLKEDLSPEDLTRTKEFPWPPSAVINSGGGWHVYWFLKAPGQKEDIPRIEGRLKALAAYFGADPSAAEAARILRLPGTYNHKYFPPRPVLLSRFDPWREYNLSDFDFLPEAKVGVQNFEPLQNPCGRGRETSAFIPEEYLQGVPQGRRHRAALKLAGRYLGRGLGPQETLDFLLGWNQKNAPPLLEEEIKRVVSDLAKAQEKKSSANPDGKRATGDGQRLSLVSLGELLKEEEENTAYVVENLLPQGGFSLLAGKPKVGKSTLARQLALAVARGEAFLGRAVQKGPVVYLPLEEKRSEVRRHFAAMGAEGPEEIYVLGADASPEIFSQLEPLVEDKKPVLLIIDPLFRLARVKDGNDYAQMTRALEPFLDLARKSGTHLLCAHHINKAARGGGDGILGSTAIYGIVDTALFIRSLEQGRTLSSIQRYGPDMPEVYLDFDPSREVCTLGSLKEELEMRELEQKIQKWVHLHPETTETEMLEGVEGRARLKAHVLRRLLSEGKVLRQGEGKRGAPYTYNLPFAPFAPSPL
jgi:hypothetical protein